LLLFEKCYCYSSKILSNRNESIIAVDLNILNENFEEEEEEETIRINVSGNRYETYLSTVERYPSSLLGNKLKRIYYWKEKTNEYFFDRHRTCFESILYYYQSNGRLRRPDSVPLDTFFEEVSFFQLGEEAIEQINKQENLSFVEPIELPRFAWRQSIWFYLEYPQHSMFARVLHLISLFVTVISCLSMAIETLPQFDDKKENICKHQSNVSLSSSFVPHYFCLHFFLLKRFVFVILQLNLCFVC